MSLRIPLPVHTRSLIFLHLIFRRGPRNRSRNRSAKITRPVSRPAGPQEEMTTRGRGGGDKNARVRAGFRSEVALLSTMTTYDNGRRRRRRWRKTSRTTRTRGGGVCGRYYGRTKGLFASSRGSGGSPTVPSPHQPCYFA